MPPQFASRSTESLLDEVEDVIKSVVRRKLRVTLRPSDYREQNLDAQEVVSEIRLKLIRKIQENDPEQGAAAIQQFSGYAATVAYHCCNDYLRAKYPHRTSFKNCLRRLLEKTDRCALWAANDGDWLCGFVGWRNRSLKTDSARVQQLRHDAGSLPEGVLPKVPFDRLPALSLLALVEAVFEHVGTPVPLDDLIAITAPLLGVEELVDVSEPDDPEGREQGLDAMPSSQPTPYAIRLTFERLKLYWAAVLQLLPWHRVAFLLNLRDADLEALPEYGVATLEQIGDALELKHSQLETLAREVGVSLAEFPASERGCGAKFLIFFKYLPLEDEVIAKVLGVTRPQVIGYRNKAKERLARNLRGQL